MKKTIWTKQQQEAIEQYIYCVTASTSAETRQYLFNNFIHKGLSNIIDTVCLKVNSSYYNDDIKQDLIIYSYTNILPTLNAIKIKGFLQYAYLCIRNQYINILRSNNNKPKYIVGQEPMYTMISNYNVDNDINVEELKALIVNGLNQKIRKEKVVNRSTTLFLIMLKDYLIENEYDERGFYNFIVDKMKLSKQNFTLIASKVKVYPKIMKEKIIENN